MRACQDSGRSTDSVAGHWHGSSKAAAHHDEALRPSPRHSVAHAPHTFACGDAIEGEPSTQTGALRAPDERDAGSEDPIDERDPPTPRLFDPPPSMLTVTQPPNGNPNQVAIKSGQLKEVDVVHIGGRDSLTQPLLGRSDDGELVLGLWRVGQRD